MNYDLKAWFKTISHPDVDWLAVGMFADWLDEQGHPFAEGMRWAYDSEEEPSVLQVCFTRNQRTWTWYAQSGIGKDVFWAFQPEPRPKKHRYAMGNEHKTKMAAWIAFYRSWMKARVKDEKPVQLFGR